MQAVLSEWRERANSLQEEARKLLPTERVAACGRTPRGTIEVKRNTVTNQAFLSNLVTCGSIWTCPWCALKIGLPRRLEVQRALEAHLSAGGLVFEATLTLRHDRSELLDEVLVRFGHAWRALQQRSSWRRFKSTFGVIGTIRALEVTHGRHGWHVHSHLLLFVDQPAVTADQLDAALAARWASAAGPDVSEERGVKVKAVDDAKHAARYLTKAATWALGGLQQQPPPPPAPGSPGRTPAELLEASSHGDEAAGRLWSVYARAFKGRRWLEWSRGLRERLLGPAPELADEAVAQRTTERLLGLTTLGLKKVRGNDAVNELLALAATGDDEALAAFLAALGVESEDVVPAPGAEP